MKVVYAYHLDIRVVLAFLQKGCSELAESCYADSDRMVRLDERKMELWTLIDNLLDYLDRV